MIVEQYDEADDECLLEIVAAHVASKKSLDGVGCVEAVEPVDAMELHAAQRLVPHSEN